MYRMRYISIDCRVEININAMPRLNSAVRFFLAPAVHHLQNEKHVAYRSSGRRSGCFYLPGRLNGHIRLQSYDKA